MEKEMLRKRIADLENEIKNGEIEGNRIADYPESTKYRSMVNELDRLVFEYIALVENEVDDRVSGYSREGAGE